MGMPHTRGTQGYVTTLTVSYLLAMVAELHLTVVRWYTYSPPPPPPSPPHRLPTLSPSASPPSPSPSLWRLSSKLASSPPPIWKKEVILKSTATGKASVKASHSLHIGRRRKMASLSSPFSRLRVPAHRGKVYDRLHLPLFVFRDEGIHQSPPSLQQCPSLHWFVLGRRVVAMLFGAEKDNHFTRNFLIDVAHP